MKTNDIERIENIELCSNMFEKEIGNLYSCDLLSWVLGHVHESNTVLLTVLNSMNAVAVASLLDMSAIVFCDGVVPTQDIIDKANEENITLFTSSQSTFDTAYAIKKIQG